MGPRKRVTRVFVPLLAFMLLLLPLACERSSTSAGTGITTPIPASLSVTIQDERGDINVDDPPYSDVVTARVQRGTDDFSFDYELAADVPANTARLGKTPFGWAFCIDTDQVSYPAGYPFPALMSVSCEFALSHAWDGHRYVDELIDRRPLLHDQDAIVSRLTVSGSGKSFSFSVPASALDEPTSFLWHMGSFSRLGGEISDIDVVPDDGLDLPAQWPGDA